MVVFGGDLGGHLVCWNGQSRHLYGTISNCRDCSVLYYDGGNVHMLFFLRWHHDCENVHEGGFYTRHGSSLVLPYTMNILYTTLWISIFLQIVTGILNLVVLINPIDPSLTLIRHLLFGEFAVQVVEASFYVYWASKFSEIENITPKRYFDWMLTTPTMLITLILYSVYLGHKESDMDVSRLKAVDLLRENWCIISLVVLLNASMLLCGYLGEIHKLPQTMSVIMGFIPFFIMYAIIYYTISIQSREGMVILYYFLFFWSLYGIAALCSYTVKNTMYNILDIFAKNFFGIFLMYVIYYS